MSERRISVWQTVTFPGGADTRRRDRLITLPATKAADNVGCGPPQPKILARRGRRIPATSSFVRWPPAWPPDSPQLDLKRLAGLV